jgi:hypothetical protein
MARCAAGAALDIPRGDERQLSEDLGAPSVAWAAATHSVP